MQYIIISLQEHGESAKIIVCEIIRATQQIHPHNIDGYPIKPVAFMDLSNETYEMIYKMCLTQLHCTLN